MQLLDLPYELLVQVISNLTSKQAQSLIQCSNKLYRHALQDYFWFDLCRLKGINYCDPGITWKQLYHSGDLSSMCPHLSHSTCKSLSKKKQQLWSHSFNGSDILCLHPSCDYLGPDTNHHHPIVLKLSSLHALELWCNSCVKAIGFDGFASQMKQGIKTEIYIMKKIVGYLATATHQDKNLVQGRQHIESSLYQYQYRQSTMHIVEKKWFSAWIDFISGKSNQIPGSVSNSKLYLADGSLDPTLILGQDFELIGSLNRWYIERIYGVIGKIISADELPNNAEYCRMIHKIRIRQQMNQASTYPHFYH